MNKTTLDPPIKGTLASEDSRSLIKTLKMLTRGNSTDAIINNILEFAGNRTSVSRAYIFESISEHMTANTYEWCAEGVKPAIEMLKNLPKDEYSYDEIINNGIFVTDDIRTLSEEDRAILEPQGIKSMVVIPIIYQNHILGYIGFDDCKQYRGWSDEIIQLLHDLTEIIAILLRHRNMERSLRYNLDVMNTVTDNSDNMIFVYDIHTKEVLFINNAVAKFMNEPKDDILKRAPKCNEILKSILHDNCIDCPLNYLLESDGTIHRNHHSWECENRNHGKWYLIRDSLIKWIDGRDVLIETATDISRQKEYEIQLQYIASRDAMTDIYNREWGNRLINAFIENSASLHTLTFIDIDALKAVNDRYGHNAGDFVILKTIEIIKSCIRKGDVICRWGGDEFILITPGGAKAASLIMARIKQLLKEYNDTRKSPIMLDFSYGIVEINPKLNQNLDRLLAEADKRMYQDKLSKKPAE